MSWLNEFSGVFALLIVCQCDEGEGFKRLDCVESVGNTE